MASTITTAYSASFDKCVYANSTKTARAYCLANGEMWFWSYSTLVAHLDSKGWLRCSGTYSATTRKHLGRFAKLISDQTGMMYTYYDFKRCFDDNTALNIRTGEVKRTSKRFFSNRA